MPLYEVQKIKCKEFTMQITLEKLRELFLRLVLLNAELDVLEDTLAEEAV